MSITKFRLVNNLLEFSTTTYSTKVHTCCPGLLREMPPPFLLKIFLLKKFCFESIPPFLLGKSDFFSIEFENFESKISIVAIDSAEAEGEMTQTKEAATKLE